jgi:hypothetical protein
MDALKTEPKTALELDPIERWNVFNRLQELSIACECVYGQPLQVEVTGPTTVLQVWSVVRRLTSSREAAIDALENCWKQVAYR